MSGERREIAWTPERQDVLEAAQDGELHWFNPGGLGGSYIRRDAFVFGVEGRHPVRLLVMAEALVHGEQVLSRPGRRRVALTPTGQHLLEKWRARRI